MLDAARRRAGRSGGVEVGRMFDGVKVFTATKSREREELGEAVTRWIDEHPELEIVDKVVTQSSDKEYHCLTITIFYRRSTSAG